MTPEEEREYVLRGTLTPPKPQPWTCYLCGESVASFTSKEVLAQVDSYLGVGGDEDYLIVHHPSMHITGDYFTLLTLRPVLRSDPECPPDDICILPREYYELALRGREHIETAEAGKRG